MHFPLSRLFRIITRVSVNSCERNACVDTRRDADMMREKLRVSLQLTRFRIYIKFILLLFYYQPDTLNVFFATVSNLTSKFSIDEIVNLDCNINYYLISSTKPSRRCSYKIILRKFLVSFLDRRTYVVIFSGISCLFYVSSKSSPSRTRIDMYLESVQR